VPEPLTRIAEGLDIAPALAELAACEDHWLEMMPGARQILMIAENGNRRMQGELGQCWALIDQVHGIAAREHKDRGRIDYARAGLMRPGEGLPRHRDGFDPARERRYQIALQSAPGANLVIEDISIAFAPGEAWWIDVGRQHSIHNGSDTDRIVLLFDTRA
jgi:hypothetical protein